MAGLVPAIHVLHCHAGNGWVHDDKWHV